ncbi:MAG: hypothetical protein JSV54_06405 [Chloroflexota bacterium]|nr:MAG: hypothetical protein JSV54_06405 [Chloroflexota bacterium]
MRMFIGDYKGWECYENRANKTYRLTAYFEGDIVRRQVRARTVDELERRIDKLALEDPDKDRELRPKVVERLNQHRKKVKRGD